MISDKCAFKQNKPSLAVITNNQEIKTFAQQLFNYVLDSIEDKNVEGFIKNECYNRKRRFILFKGTLIRNHII
jgi:tRNA A37 threonylcarbamoyladenosine dehydratase